jgi:hypothetical protein
MAHAGIRFRSIQAFRDSVALNVGDANAVFKAVVQQPALQLIKALV